uniref:RNA polymerase-associated protein LEO1 n=1 Tax=Ascaris lumbricoides TaxID=6252 RepID=A0A0M3I890_ASCLU
MSSDESTSAANSSGDEGAPESPTGNEDAPRSPTGSEGSPVDSPAQTTSSEEDHSEDAHSDVNEPPKAARSSDTAEDSDDSEHEDKSDGNRKSEQSEKGESSDEGPAADRSAHFTLGGSDADSSRSPPSERQPEPSSEKKRVVLSSDEESEDASKERGKEENEAGGLGDIDLSESSDDDNNKDLTEDDIVGPRLYPDPEAMEEEEDRPEPTIVEVNTARICPNFKDEGLYFVKFPNFLSIEPRPFDHEHYEDEFDEDEQMDEEGRARLKLRVENTIRWRYAFDEGGNIVKLSNSKIVRWSDGTMSLFLGSEAFDVQVQPMQHDNHLFMRQGAGLQGHAVFKEKLTFRPVSTDSITHRKVTLSMADRSNKSQKVKVLNAVGVDPESQKAELVRREEERLRAQNRREAQLRRNKMRPSVRTGLSANFLEEREDDSDESLSAIKKHYKNRYDDRPLIGHSDSEDSDSKTLHDAKKDSDESDSDQVKQNILCCHSFELKEKI